MNREAYFATCAVTIVFCVVKARNMPFGKIRKLDMLKRFPGIPKFPTIWQNKFAAGCLSLTLRIETPVNILLGQ
jgi:hypothetical protein